VTLNKRLRFSRLSVGGSRRGFLIQGLKKGLVKAAIWVSSREEADVFEREMKVLFDTTERKRP
jgi:hypothetical protein